MVALERRAEEGGSWLVRISLAQVGKWIVDLGEVPAAELAGVPADFAAEELDAWSMVSETPSGRLQPSEAGGRTVGNATLLGPAVGAAGLSSADMAGLACPETA